jgi:hypothetical protein
MYLDPTDHDVFPRDRFDVVYAMGDFHGDLTAASVCFALLTRVATYVGDDGKKGKLRLPLNPVIKSCACPRSCAGP